MQIKQSVTNPTIADVYERIQSRKLDLQPEFQRKFVWTLEHQEKFIETILLGYPFPEIYVSSAGYDHETRSTSQKVIDGQQRLTTIRNYIDDIYIENKPFKLIPRFNDLEKEKQKNFMEYQLVFRDIGDVEDNVIREIFKRINLTKFKLEDIEIHNAVYDGAFIQTAKKILDGIDKKQLLNIFHESELTRMGDLYFILQIMATIENDGYYNRDKELELYIAKYNENYKNSTKMASMISNVLNNISSFNLEDSSIWFRKSNFFTLMVEIIKNYEYIENSSLNLKENLILFEEKILENKNKDNDYGDYYSAMYTGTNNRKARIIRADLFDYYVLKINENKK